MASLTDLAPIPLRGRHVYVEPLEERHAAGLFAASQDEAIWTYLPRGPMASEVDALRFIQEARARMASGREFPYAIRLCATDQLIGSTRFQDIQPVHQTVEIGWTFVHPSRWGNGAATESHFLLARHALEDLGVGRVWFKTDARNLRTQRALERFGVTREGVLRKHLRLRDGFVRDSVIYAIIQEEWPEVKRRAEEVLAQWR